MTETLQHKEAFEYYYSLGDNRSLPQVAQKFTVSTTSLKKWSGAFNWQERVLQRDIEIGKKLVTKTNTTVLNEKAKYRRLIQDAIAGMGDIKVETVKDYEIMVKLDLLLMGEATSNDTVIFKGDDKLED